MQNFLTSLTDPLVNVSMKPDTHVKVTISAHQEAEVREEIIPVKQTVGQFKTQLNQWFHIPIQNMRLYYCDQVRKCFNISQHLNRI